MLSLIEFGSSAVIPRVPKGWGADLIKAGAAYKYDGTLFALNTPLEIEREEKQLPREERCSQFIVAFLSSPPFSVVPANQPTARQPTNQHAKPAKPKNWFCSRGFAV